MEDGSDLIATQLVVWTDTPPIPKGTQPLAHQVAGHVFGRQNGHRKNQLGFLQSEDGYILKPVQGPGKGQREVKFYQTVFDSNCDDEAFIQLRQFMPAYVNVWSTIEHPGLSYLKLEDVTKRFSKPCIMDIKVGPVTYDSEADAAKRSREMAKFPALERVGFQLVGIKAYSPVNEEYKTIERTFLRALDEKSILTQGIIPYLSPDEVLEPRLVRAFLRRLSAIESWFLGQHKYAFIASSLLFVYDGEALPKTIKRHNSCSTNGLANDAIHQNVDVVHQNNGVSNERKDRTGSVETEEDAFFDSHIDVRMIDFTHVFPANGLDENYLTGLRSLMGYLRRLVAS